MSSGAVGGGQSNGSPFIPCLNPQSIHSSTSFGWRIARVPRWQGMQKICALMFFGYGLARTRGSGWYGLLHFFFVKNRFRVVGHTVLHIDRVGRIWTRVRRFVMF